MKQSFDTSLNDVERDYNEEVEEIEAAISKMDNAVSNMNLKSLEEKSARGREPAVDLMFDQVTSSEDDDEYP